MKGVILFVGLALLMQCGQSRQLLEDPVGEMVKCENTTADVDCSTYISGAVSDVWAFDGTKDVWNNETDPAVKNAACCVFNATSGSTCANVTCGVDRVKVAAPPSVAGKLVVEAENLCCEPAFTLNDNCSTVFTGPPVVACPAKKAPVTIADGQLVEVAKSDAERQLEVCCVSLEPCDDTSTVCPYESMTKKNSSFIPDTEDDRESFCCLYPVDATCTDLTADESVNETGFLNCTDSPNGAYAFAVEEPLAFSRNTPEAVQLVGKDYFEALDVCCEKVQYAATATCEANFDCAKVEPAGSLVNNPLAVEVSLAGINIVNETGVAEICCSAAPAPGTVATWLEDVEACSDLNVTAAKKVEGTAALVADSADASCPETCIADATIEIVIDGTCRYAVFTPKGTDCPVAAGTVTINATTGIMIGINGAFPASGDAFSVTPVEGVARQLEVAIGETCKAKYLLDDALFAKLDGETVKNSATGKAASFLAAVLALLAMLVL